MTASRTRPVIGIALEPFGWHPAAFAEVGADPLTATSAEHWVGLARSAEAAAADFVSFEDSFTLTARDRLSGRFDATLLAARVAPSTTRIGLVPTVTATHTEPFHASKAIATLDYVSKGRAGVLPATTGRQADAELFGRKPTQDSASQAAEALEYVRVLRDLWDSWDDDAVIRDVETGRFVDRERLHYIDFRGEYFDVKGPSITPRPPQGQPVVLARVNDLASESVAAVADIAIVPGGTDEQIVAVATRLRAAGVTRILGDVTVFLADSERTAARRIEKLDRREELADDALVFAGTGAELALLVERWQRLGLDGVRLRPGVNAVDLPRLRDTFAPLLAGRPATGTFPDLLGLSRPAGRFAKAGGAQ
ncbi:Fmnh2-utilizing oxygenase OS=Tsukamurella paurometabola (strain ATCC 8368 / DSM / CCUG 35730/ CIP 100753 / JCM 10117 / KCTC 9821 / NBRC 16120 / NCIMB 702349/ NCTC 13040) OX=521096 GN=Tpau_1981 PE=3 SV=1 [Tsukamurella paurometabola]|uniref:Fmnh2-utilizing oxygenase n=1 Tax=Tsukamurella paurometabola (strain ATCC 8368 / DSM 20162 / CCUG 35730 / CIP 100753 / JCM 10117 / KCTC 9821 / NBRC 16120 / NCIMB 702349 / NCTC 13040) TaxID=521096 RepID=D5UNM5_TSUPD|nr:LLM class flavin-dependent oxidoreductase [Tsukamurella paurometabola]ADG78593.1 fmnh2-utilizing oxygenase [Tsukamurella paurometabola DSM 20162]SUP32340.1 Nitrilotriacetate monooxygenase component A [Tsukamurella paurometabola]